MKRFLASLILIITFSFLSNPSFVYAEVSLNEIKSLPITDPKIPDLVMEKVALYLFDETLKNGNPLFISSSGNQQTSTKFFYGFTTDGIVQFETKDNKVEPLHIRALVSVDGKTEKGSSTNGIQTRKLSVSIRMTVDSRSEYVKKAKSKINGDIQRFKNGHDKEYSPEHLSNFRSYKKMAEEDVLFLLKNGQYIHKSMTPKKQTTFLDTYFTEHRSENLGLGGLVEKKGKSWTVSVKKSASYKKTGTEVINYQLVVEEILMK